MTTAREQDAETAMRVWKNDGRSSNEAKSPMLGRYLPTKRCQHFAQMLTADPAD